MQQTLLFVFMMLVSAHALAQKAELDMHYQTGTGFNGTVHASALQDDGKAIFGGSFTEYDGVEQNRIARLNADGMLDTDFAGAIGDGFNSTVMAIVVQEDGKILVAGAFTEFDGATQNYVARLNSDGTLDTEFDTEGTGFNATYLTALAVLSDGRIAVGGWFTKYNGVDRNAVALLNDDGSLDQSFDPGEGFNAAPEGLAIQPGNTIVAVGAFDIYQGVQRRAVAHLDTDGSLLNSFNPMLASGTEMYAVAVHTDGAIVIGGKLSTASYLFKINEAGESDFGFSFASGSFRAVAVQPDGKVIVGGSFSNGIWRLNANGTTDTFVSGNGFEVGGSVVNTLLIQPDGKVIASGTFSSYNGIEANRVARIGACSAVAITTQPEPAAACDEAEVTLSLAASGTGLTYQWQVNTNSGSGIFADVSTDPEYTFTANGSMHNNVYRCLVSDGTCSTTSSTLILSVHTPQSIVADPQDKAVCEGSTTTFTATVSGTQGQFQWQVDEGEGFVDLVDGDGYSGVSTTSLGLSGVSKSRDGFKYRLVAALCSSPAISEPATLSVSDVPVITNPPVAVRHCVDNGDIVLAVEAEGSELTYQWQGYTGSSTYTDLADGVNGGATFYAAGTYSGTASSELVISDAPANVFSDGYSYRVVVSNNAGCAVNSGIVTNYIYDMPTITAHPADVVKCAESGGDITFSLATDNDPFGLTYRWQVDTGSGYEDLDNVSPYGGATGKTLTVTGPNITADMNGYKYRCGVGNCDPGNYSFEATLTVDSRPSITALTSSISGNVVCQGDEVSYSVEVAGDDIVYQWQRSTNGGNSYSDLSDDDHFFGSQSETLVISDLPENFSGGIFRCIVNTNVGACADVASGNTLLNVRGTPSITTQPADKIICEGADTNLNFFYNYPNSFGDNSSVQWQIEIDGLFVDLSDNEVYSQTSGRPLMITGAPANLDGTRYRARVGSCFPETYTQEVTLALNKLPVVTAHPEPSSQTICPGGGVTLFVEAEGTGLTFQWLRKLPDGSIGGVSGVGATTNTLTISNANANHNGEYYCVVKGTCDPVGVESNKSVLVVDQALVTQHPEPHTTLYPGEDVTFSIVASGGEGLTYQWQEAISAGGYSNIGDGGLFSGTGTPNLTLSGVTSSASYRCIVTGSCDTSTPVTSFEANLTVKGLSQQPQNSTICEGGDAHFNAFANWTSVNYQWQVNTGGGFGNIVDGGIYAGSNSSELSVTGATSAASYRCLLSGECEMTSEEVTLDFVAVPKPVVTVDLSNPDAPVLETSSGGSQYQWFKNGTPISGATSHQYTVSGEDGEGSYAVQIWVDGCSSELSDAVSLAVTSVAGLWENREIAMYPNPASNELTLHLETFDSNVPVQVSIVDRLGRTVKTTSAMGNETLVINVQDLSAGNYIVRMQQRHLVRNRQFMKSTH